MQINGPAETPVEPSHAPVIIGQPPRPRRSQGRTQGRTTPRSKPSSSSSSPSSSMCSARSDSTVAPSPQLYTRERRYDSVLDNKNLHNSSARPGSSCIADSRPGSAARDADGRYDAVVDHAASAAPMFHTANPPPPPSSSSSYDTVIDSEAAAAAALFHGATRPSASSTPMHMYDQVVFVGSRGDDTGCYNDTLSSVAPATNTNAGAGGAVGGGSKSGDDYRYYSTDRFMIDDADDDAC
jgi:hypothetical protein